MALSGTFHNYPVSSFGLYCEWSASQSVTGNYSNVTLKVYLSYYTLEVGARNDATIAINGTSETYSTGRIRDYSSGWKKELLKTKTVRVNHASNGTATGIPLSASWRFGGTYSGVQIGTITASTTVDLETIDRVSNITAVSTFTADDNPAKPTLSVTVYNTSYTHTLIIKNGSTTVLSISSLRLVNGLNTITLTSAQRSDVLAAMSSIKSFTGTYELSTFSGSTQIGPASSKTATVQTTAANSAPVFSGFTYADTETKTTAITENNQILVQAQSTLEITCTEATPKNGASIVKYCASVGTKTVESNSTTIVFGKITNAGNLSLTVKAIDSRGYETSETATIEVLAYENILITSWAVRRENEVGSAIHLEFTGSISPITIDGIAKNALSSIKCRYKRSWSPLSSYSGYFPLEGVEHDSSSFSYTNDHFIELPPENSYDIEITAEDELTASAVTLFVSKGEPLVSFRARKVGVNTNDPQAALDVNGSIMMNGVNVMGFVRPLGSTNFDEITEPGVYTADSGSTNAPANAAEGILEVFANNGDPRRFIQRFTEFRAGCAMYIRSGGVALD